MGEMTDAELGLLDWLSKEEFSQYGECHGETLDKLIANGLAQVCEPGAGQGGFIAKDHTGAKGMMYRAVTLTDAGRAALKRERA